MIRNGFREVLEALQGCNFKKIGQPFEIRGIAHGCFGGFWGLLALNTSFADKLVSLSVVNPNKGILRPTVEVSVEQGVNGVPPLQIMLMCRARLIPLVPGPHKETEETRDARLSVRAARESWTLEVKFIPKQSEAELSQGGRRLRLEGQNRTCDLLMLRLLAHFLGVLDKHSEWPKQSDGGCLLEYPSIRNMSPQQGEHQEGGNVVPVSNPIIYSVRGQLLAR